MPEAPLELLSFTARGQTRYCCPSCGFDSYTVELVLKHWHSAHQEVTANTGPTLFDAKGNAIETREIHARDEIQSLLSRITRG